MIESRAGRLDLAKKILQDFNSYEEVLNEIRKKIKSFGDYR